MNIYFIKPKVILVAVNFQLLSLCSYLPTILVRRVQLFVFVLLEHSEMVKSKCTIKTKVEKKIEVGNTLKSYQKVVVKQDRMENNYICFVSVFTHSS